MMLTTKVLVQILETQSVIGMPIVKLRDDELIDHGGVMKLIDRHQVIRFAEEYSHLEKGDIVHFWSTKKLRYAKRPLLDKYFGKGTILSSRVAKWKDIKADDRIARRERFENSAEMRKSFEKRYGKKLHGHSDMRILSRFDLEIGYCDCCDKKAIITWHIETFNGGGLKACEDCGRKVLYVLRERST